MKKLTADGRRFVVKQRSVDALAKEFRRVAWGGPVVLAAFGYTLDQIAAILLAGGFWLLFQALAVVVESFQVEGDSHE